MNGRWMRFEVEGFGSDVVLVDDDLMSTVGERGWRVRGDMNLLTYGDAASILRVRVGYALESVDFVGIAVCPVSRVRYGTVRHGCRRTDDLMAMYESMQMQLQLQLQSVADSLVGNKGLMLDVITIR